jgi:PhzF family phenazine biosynthesis protein
MIQVLHFDAFSRTPGKGNPAGIVLRGDGLVTEKMQAIAAATALNDTAFIFESKEADFAVRYFSPRTEVNLCGHATITAAIALRTRGALIGRDLPCQFSLKTNVGILPIVIDSDESGGMNVFMSQPAAIFEPFNGDRNLLLKAIGINEDDLASELPIVYGYTGLWTLAIPVRDLAAMRRLHPNSAQFPRALTDKPGASIHPFCLQTIGEGSHLHARHFPSPASGGVEDPVTGTASGVLGAYHLEFIDPHRDASKPLVVEQGHEMGREGRVLVWAAKGAGGYSIRIAGTASFSGEYSYQ